MHPYVIIRRVIVIKVRIRFFMQVKVHAVTYCAVRNAHVANRFSFFFFCLSLRNFRIDWSLMKAAMQQPLFWTFTNFEVSVIMLTGQKKRTIITKRVESLEKGRDRGRKSIGVLSTIYALWMPAIKWRKKKSTKALKIAAARCRYVVEHFL